MEHRVLVDVEKGLDIYNFLFFRVLLIDSYESIAPVSLHRCQKIVFLYFFLFFTVGLDDHTDK